MQIFGGLFPRRRLYGNRSPLAIHFGASKVGDRRRHDRHFDAVPTAVKLTDEIADTVRSDDPLPPASDAQSLLAASIQKAASEQASQVGVTPELVKTVSGKTYKFRDNDLRVRTFLINLLGSNPSWEITTATQRLDRPTAGSRGPRS